MPEKIFATLPFPASLHCELHPAGDFTFYSRDAFKDKFETKDLPCGCFSITVELVPSKDDTRLVREGVEED